MSAPSVRKICIGVGRSAGGGYGDGWDIIKLYTIEFNTSCIPTKFSLLLLESASTSHAASAFVTHTIFSHDSSHPTSVYSIHYIQPTTPEFNPDFHFHNTQYFMLLNNTRKSFQYLSGG